MQVISPARVRHRATLDTRVFGGVLNSIGTDDYDRACLDVFGLLGAEHWTIFRYRSDRSIDCVATASCVHEKAALVNVERFMNRCHTVDPSFKLLSRQSESSCVTKIELEDIEDDQYRSCFKRTEVQERLSYFVHAGSSLFQLSIFRGPRSQSYTPKDMAQFGSIASLVLATAAKHEALKRKLNVLANCLDVDDVDRFLTGSPVRLSNRERQVCARAAIGKTIEGTALDLGIKQTSVITYRQRAYQKLGITSHIELVALVNNLRMQ